MRGTNVDLSSSVQRGRNCSSVALLLIPSSRGCLRSLSSRRANLWKRRQRGGNCLLLRDSNRRLSFLHSILRTRFFSRKIQSCQIRPVSFLLVWLFATSSNGDAFLPVDARRPLFARAPGRAHIAPALAHLPCFNTAAFSYCCAVCRLLSWVFGPVLSVTDVAVTAAAVKAKAPTTHRRRGRKGKSVYRGVCVTREGKWRAVIYKERKQVRGIDTPADHTTYNYSVLSLSISLSLPRPFFSLPRRRGVYIYLFFVATPFRDATRRLCDDEKMMKPVRI